MLRGLSPQSKYFHFKLIHHLNQQESPLCWCAFGRGRNLPTPFLSLPNQQGEWPISAVLCSVKWQDTIRFTEEAQRCSILNRLVSDTLNGFTILCIKFQTSGTHSSDRFWWGVVVLILQLQKSQVWSLEFGLKFDRKKLLHFLLLQFYSLPGVKTFFGEVICQLILAWSMDGEFKTSKIQ